ncbi:unnamed protein product [Rotaria sp. Silwood2]|nr:unnamed protein product [Rotaria sp. Silwood2]CAF3083003.1 unnamed protein product [Rotaria sp. Silwood2]CAF3321732.1 unnamed protein product [Rotaria sp. Silwood2]CAF3352860.1 unnamed protein product [Rotaria sp. Silwood2]CAF4638924.1 unnamed protein product [Rotaria sp. Silwood2]
MATYSQSTGKFTTSDGTSYTGYSGNGEGLNNSDKESEAFVGPIPKGEYTVAGTNTSKGPTTLVLTPAASNKMHGRNGFLIHGDNKKGDYSASEGCIIVGPEARKKIKVGDKIVVTQ